MQIAQDVKTKRLFGCLVLAFQTGSRQSSAGNRENPLEKRSIVVRNIVETKAFDQTLRSPFNADRIQKHVGGLLFQKQTQEKRQALRRQLAIRINFAFGRC